MTGRSQSPRRMFRTWSSVFAALVFAIAIAISGTGASMSAAQATGPTVVLEFDNSSASLYTLGYLQALQPHNAKATFFLTSGSVATTSSPTQMTWAQVGTIASAGNDIGGKSDSSNLTSDPNPTAQVCNDRATIISHGLTPIGFAYPGGAQNATVQGIVQGCGYGNARTAGGVGNTVAETLPPASWLATKAYAPAAVTLANLQTIVNNAASRNDRFVQVVMSRVCDNTLDPTNYSGCSGAGGHIELSDLNNFIAWMGNAGQAGGAPAGSVLTTLSAAYADADATAPTTTIACNGAPCASSPYSGVVSVTLSATDLGTGVSSTHYTTDGSDPTLSSPTYTGAFGVNGSGFSTTVKYRSWDAANNAEAIRTQVVPATSTDSVPPTTTISCNGAACGSSSYSSPLTISLAATDTGSGVDKTYYTTDGSTPTTSSTVYSGSFQVAALGTTTVKFFSTDLASNAELVKSQSVTLADSAAPTTTISCNGAACGGSYTASVTIALSASDTGGSGVDKTYYTTDGSTPTTSSTVYSGSFQVTTLGTTTVKFFSTDVAGNKETVKSQPVTVGSTPGPVSVVLEFDNSSISAYNLGYLQALSPHNAPATFFVQSGSVGNSPTATQMSWGQLSTLAGAGNDIGGKSTSATDLTTDPNATAQVCNDRAALLSHGLTPVGFAYPGGNNNVSVQGIVQSCGYGSARTVGGSARPPPRPFRRGTGSRPRPTLRPR